MNPKQIATALKSLVRKLSELTWKSEVTNLPDVQKVKITNPTEAQETVEVSNLIDVKPELKDIVNAIEKKVQKFDDTAQKKDILKAIKDLKTTPAKDLTPDVIKGIDKSVKLLEDLLKVKPDYSEIVKALDKEEKDPLEKYTTSDKEIKVKWNKLQLKELKDAFSSIVTSSGGGSGMIKDAAGNPIDASNPLPVSATLNVGDIEIGAVELKDGDSDQRAAINSDGQLHVVLMGKVDDGNSTTTTLGNGGVFTGTAFDTLDFGFIFVTVFADQDSATNGLTFQQSSDGTNWDNVDNYSYLTNSGKTYSVQPSTKWFRIVYTNGTTPQGTFRLSTVFKKTSSLPSSHRISDNLSPEDDATLSISVIKGQKPNGDYIDYQATAAGNFKNSLEELENNISVNSNTQLRITPFDSSGNELIKLEDSVHGSGDAGIMALAVRKDSLGTLASDGDYSPLQTNEYGSLKTHEEPSKVDSGNSSTSTLVGDAVFTGTGIDVLHYQAVTIQLDASHNSATDGFEFQASIDNSNWDDTIKFTYTASEGARRFQFPTNSQYIRIVYTNGSTGQTHFRMQTILHHTTPLTSIHRISDTLTVDRSATLVRAVIVGQTSAGGGGMVNVKVNPSGTLTMEEENSEAILTAVEAIETGQLANGHNVVVTSLPIAAVDTNYFSATITSADATTATSVKAKTAAKKIYVTSLEISVGATAMEVQLQSDNGTPQVVMEENFFAANGGMTWTACDKTLPLFIVNTNEDLDIITSAAGDVTISISGYVV